MNSQTKRYEMELHNACLRGNRPISSAQGIGLGVLALDAREVGVTTGDVFWGHGLAAAGLAALLATDATPRAPRALLPLALAYSLPALAVLPGPCAASQIEICEEFPVSSTRTDHEALMRKK